MPKPKKCTREEILERQKERQRRRREQIKKDPALYEAYKEVSRQRYYKRKREGKILPLNEESPARKNILRKRNRENFKAHYRRQKEKNALKTSETLQESFSEKQLDSNRNNGQSEVTTTSGGKKTACPEKQQTTDQPLSMPSSSNESHESPENNSAACKDRWKKIRENFRKALTLRKQKVAKRLKYRPPKYYNQLNFLMPYLGDEVHSSFSIEKWDDTNPLGDADDQSDSSISNSVSSKNIKRSNSTAEMSNHEDATEQLIVFDTTSNETKPDHHVLTEFFMNMANTVSKFPIRKQLEIKEKLFRIVHAVEMEMATSYLS